jgi:hypothetical protein
MRGSLQTGFRGAGAVRQTEGWEGGEKALVHLGRRPLKLVRNVNGLSQGAAAQASAAPAAIARQRCRSKHFVAMILHYQ